MTTVKKGKVVIIKEKKIINKPKVKKVVIPEINDDKKVHNITQINISPKKTITTIFSMADLHIKNSYDEHSKKEYMGIIDRLIESIKNDPDVATGVIIICGDIFDSKLTLRPDAINMFFYLLSRACNVIDVILLSGNHDQSLSAGNCDVISPLLSMEFNTPFKPYMMKQSGLFEYNNLLIGFTDIFSNEVTKCDIVTDKIKVGAYHGYIHGTTLQNGETLDDAASKFNQTDFNEYDVVCLGDIHLHQMMRKNTMGYPSSLLQLSYGEHVFDHGYIRYSLTPKIKGEFVRIPNDYCYLTVELTDDGLVNPYGDKELPKNIRLKIKHKNAPRNQIDEVVKNLSKKYNILEYTDVRTMNGVSIDISNPTDNKKSLGELKSMNDVNREIMKYIEKEKKYSKSMIKKLSDKLDEVTKELKYNFDSDKRNMKLIEMKFSNIYIYGEGNKINFSNLKKIVGLNSDNKTGKTSMINTILYAIWGYHAYGVDFDVMKIGEKNMSTEIIISVNNVLYTIKRSYKRRTVDSQKLEGSVDLFKYDEKKKAFMLNNGDDIAGTTALIRGLCGDCSDFINLNIITQDSPSNFVFTSEPDRLKLIHKLYRTDVFNAVKRKITTLKTSANGVITKLDAEIKKIGIDNIKKNKASKESELNEAKIRYDQLEIERTELNNKILLLNEKVKEFEKINIDKCDVTEIVTTLKKYKQNDVTYQKEIKLLNDDIMKLEKNKNLLNDKIKIFKNIEEEKNTHETILKNEILKLEQEYDNLQMTKQSVITNLCNIKDIERNMKIIKDKIKLNDQDKIKISDNKTTFEQGFEKIFKLTTADIATEYANKEQERVTILNELDILTKSNTVASNSLKKMSNFKYNKECSACMSNDSTKQILTYNHDIEDNVKKIDKYNKNINDIDNYLKKNKVIYEKYHKNELNRENNISLKKSISEYDIQLKIIDSKAELLERELDECTRLIADHETASKNIEINRKISNQLLEIKNKINKQKNNKFEKYDEYMDIKNNISLQESQINIKMKKLNEYQVLNNKNKELLVVQQIKYDDKKSIIDKTEINNTNIELIKNFKKELSCANDEYTKITNRIALINNDITGFSDDIKKHIYLNDKKREENDTKDVIDNLADLMGKDGFLSSVIANILSVLEGIINGILDSVENFKIKLECDGKNIKLRKFNNNNSSNSIHGGFSSGHEKSLLNFCFRLAFINTTNLLKCNCIIADENFSATSENNMSKLKALFTFVRDNYDFMITVSHHIFIKEFFDSEINIKHSNGTSYMNC
jgi:DNA repair exonuclease SbcCD ATPase subunit